MNQKVQVTSSTDELKRWFKKKSSKQVCKIWDSSLLWFMIRVFHAESSPEITGGPIISAKAYYLAHLKTKGENLSV